MFAPDKLCSSAPGNVCLTFEIPPLLLCDFPSVNSVSRTCGPYWRVNWSYSFKVCTLYIVCRQAGICLASSCNLSFLITNSGSRSSIGYMLISLPWVLSPLLAHWTMRDSPSRRSKSSNSSVLYHTTVTSHPYSWSSHLPPALSFQIIFLRWWVSWGIFIGTAWFPSTVVLTMENSFVTILPKERLLARFSSIVIFSVFWRSSQSDALVRFLLLRYYHNNCQGPPRRFSDFEIPWHFWTRIITACHVSRFSLSVLEVVCAFANRIQNACLINRSWNIGIAGDVLRRA